MTILAGEIFKGTYDTSQLTNEYGSLAPLLHDFIKELQGDIATTEMRGTTEYQNTKHHSVKRKKILLQAHPACIWQCGKPHANTMK